MSDLRELYRDVVLDHNRKPRNRGVLSAATHRAEGYNPLCGDRVEISLIVEGGTIIEVRFTGEGCALSTASASLLTELARGCSATEVAELVRDVRGLTRGELNEAGRRDRIAQLLPFEGVGEFPTRVKCVTLAWHTLQEALIRGSRASEEKS